MAKEMYRNFMINYLTIKNEKRFYTIEIHTKGYSGPKRIQKLFNDKGNIKQFKSLDAAYNACKSIGISSVNIDG